MMSTYRLPATTVEEQKRAVEKAARLLRHGALVVIPTDTVYGVAASLDWPDAVERIFEAKGRPAQRSLPILADSADAAWRTVRDVSPGARALGDRFWPGGITLVLDAGRPLPPGVAAADGSVGVRVPAHPVALAILQACGGTLAVTSANRSGEPSAKTAQAALDALGDWVGAVIDAGPAPVGRDSTVVDARGDEPRLLRPGAVAWEDVLSVWGAASKH